MIPLVSILTPVYNAAPYIELSVRSALAQTLADFEQIIINDGSTDQSLTIVQRLASEDSRIRVISRSNQGISATRSELISLARGRYMAWLDGDDILEPNRLEMQVDFLESHPDHVGVGSAALLIDPDGDPIGPWSSVVHGHDAINASLMSCGWPIINSSFLARTDAVRKVGGIRSFSIREDHDLFLRLAEVGRLENLPETLVSYRLHCSSAMHQASARSRELLVQMITEAAIRRGVPVPLVPEIPTDTRADQLSRWAWWALSAGNKRTARKYAFPLLTSSPYKLSNWRLALCALRGR